jgi:hypothetical protein
VSTPLVARVLRPAEVLLVVPPFAYVDRPALGAHLLQAIARAAGFETQVLYANILFAAFFDEGTHNTFSKMGSDLLGERIFARTAYGGPALGADGGAALAPKLEAMRRAYAQKNIPFGFTMAAIQAVEARVPAFVELIAQAIGPRGYEVVGASSSFEQNSGSLAILNAIKRANPKTVTVLGGANCEGEMAEGVAALSDLVDHVCEGESERTWPELLEALRRGERPARILHGRPCQDLDAIPTPDYADYYEHLRWFLPASPVTARGLSCLTYETSRGCWWGEKSHCTFCGLNGQGMASREKSPDRVVTELKQLLAAHPVADGRGVAKDARGVVQGRRDRGTKLVVMTDNIMPHAYFRTLLPRLEAELPGVTLMYEMKANLSLEQVRLMMKAGVTEIQPGIEALSTGLLKLMAKGTTAAQNVALLRYAGATGMYLYWNLLQGFPGDEASFYEETLELMPLLHHLQPPTNIFPVVFDRFSPYFDQAERHGVRNLRPATTYRAVYPAGAPLEKIAYHFEGDCATATGARPELLARMAAALTDWRVRHYAASPAQLLVARTGAGEYRLIDRRVAGQEIDEPIDEERAVMALVPRMARGVAPGAYAWALERKLVVVRDDRFVPLALAHPDLLAELEGRHRRRTGALQLAV